MKQKFPEMAQAIKSAKFFIGNLSVAYPIAEAMKIPRLLEACPEFPVVQPIGGDGYIFTINRTLKNGSNIY